MIRIPAKSVRAAPVALTITVLIIAALALSACAPRTDRIADPAADGPPKGSFRTDYAPADAPYDNDDLKRNFIEVALFREFARSGVEAQRTEAELSRWGGPIRYAVAGGRTSSADIADIGDLMERLSAISGLDIATDADDPNFLIFIIDERERTAVLSRLSEGASDDEMAFRRAWAAPTGRRCIGEITFDESGDIAAGLVLIKAEVTGLARKACIHEEIVQALGLTNDADDIRPSLFNDDGEFALMTEHDEYLLRILYDDRLRSGMSRADVEPKLDAILAGIRPQDGAKAPHGYLRTDVAPPDAPFDNVDLARNFERIALHSEYRQENGVVREETTPALIARWTQPILYRLSGGGVTAADARSIANFAGRLSRLTGVDVRAATAEESPNVSIVILDRDERPDFVASLRENGAAERLPLIVEWARKARYLCIGQVGYDEAPGEIEGAMIVIKAELEGATREGCIHEELSQAMGLLNDDDRVRPSIFNDDGEFALLTAHDEYLLRILYDPELRPGMSAAEVAPILPEIIARIRPEG